VSREGEATLFMTLLAAFSTLLHRSSGRDDLVIGSPIANRNRGEIEPLIGFFVNTLALRIDLGGRPTFVDLLARVRRTALEAYAHQDLPFEKLVDALQPERDLSLNPLFQVMFALQNAPMGRTELPGLTLEPFETKRAAALFDLVLDLWETGDTLTGVLEFNTDLFDESTADRIVRNFQTLLREVAADPTRTLDDLPWLTDEEQRWLLEVGRGPRRAYPLDRTVHDLFEEAVARGPGRVAAVHDGRRITYAELEARANRIAHRLRGLGVRPNDFVGILDRRGPDLLAAMLGVLKSGGAFLPIDPSYPADRIRSMLDDSRCRS
jgi:non-ribosomal peptide synthetase component F